MAKRMLCVTAHPDDEAGGFGGSLLLYAGQQVETYIVCLTPGQAARHRGGHVSDNALAAARRQEFAASCQMLKVTHGEVLDYPDSKLSTVPLDLVVADLVERIRHIRPHVIISFGPEGAVTAHPDHSMASIFATMAFHWACRTNRYPEQLQNGLAPWMAQKLYWSTAGFKLPERQPIAPAPRTAVIDVAPFMETKVAAFKLHTTQAPLFPTFEKNVRLRGTVEMFHLAACSRPMDIEPETDLFAGVEED
jgi:LmbE family N-acetylglucosaminyl deacetylase